MAATDHRTGGRHEAEASAIEHLWPHSNDLEWDEFTERGLRVFVSGKGSTLTDVQGRSYLDGLAGLFLVNVGHGRPRSGRRSGRCADDGPHRGLTAGRAGVKGITRHIAFGPVGRYHGDHGRRPL